VFSPPVDIAACVTAVGVSVSVSACDADSDAHCCSHDITGCSSSLMRCRTLQTTRLARQLSSLTCCADTKLVLLPNT
jgi:hypothetical protein